MLLVNEQIASMYYCMHPTPDGTTQIGKHSPSARHLTRSAILGYWTSELIYEMVRFLPRFNEDWVNIESLEHALGRANKGAS
jgi:hypothetical protein